MGVRVGGRGRDGQEEAVDDVQKPQARGVMLPTTPISQTPARSPAPVLELSVPHVGLPPHSDASVLRRSHPPQPRYASGLLSLVVSI